MGKGQVAQPWRAFKSAAVILLSLALTGCLCPNAATIRALATDPATVKLNVRTPWGAMDFERSNAAAPEPHGPDPDHKLRPLPPR